MNEAFTYAERLAASQRLSSLDTVLGLIEQTECEIHETPAGRPCDPRICLARAEDAGRLNLISGPEFVMLTGLAAS